MSFRESLRLIRAAHPPEKRAWDRAHLWIGFVARPLSFPLSAWLLEAGATANQVTLATGVVAYGSLGLLASGRPGWMLAGGLGLALYNLLDCVDGNLARARPPERPPRGKFFDQLVGLAYPLSYLALGVGLRGEGGLQPAWELVHLGASSTAAWKALALGAAAACARLAAKCVRSIFWSVLGEAWEGEKRKGAGTPHAARWYYAPYYLATDLQSHVILLPAALWGGFAFEFLAASAAAQVLELAGLAALHLRRAWRLGEAA